GNWEIWQPFPREKRQETQNHGGGLDPRQLFFQGVQLPIKQIGEGVQLRSHIHRASKCQPVTCAITKCGNFSSRIDYWGFRECVKRAGSPETHAESAGRDVSGADRTEHILTAACADKDVTELKLFAEG